MQQLIPIQIKDSTPTPYKLDLYKIIKIRIYYKPLSASTAKRYVSRPKPNNTPEHTAESIDL